MLTFFSDLTELELPDTMKTVFPDPTDVLNFNLTITPDEGEWVARNSVPPLLSPAEQLRLSLAEHPLFPLAYAVAHRL